MKIAIKYIKFIIFITMTPLILSCEIYLVDKYLAAHADYINGLNAMFIIAAIFMAVICQVFTKD